MKETLRIFGILLMMTVVKPSIVGLTYRDDADFEPRSDKNDCDPERYYPLHLPEHCADIYEKIIRSELGHAKPIDSPHNFYYKTGKIAVPKTIEDVKYKMPKYQKMVDTLNEDIVKAPTEPKVVMSNIGPVAVLEQLVSEKSAKMMRDLANDKKITSKRKHRKHHKKHRRRHPF